MIWQKSHRADPRACAIADRHYSRQKIGSPQFMPPGSCVCFYAKICFIKHYQSNNALG